jgi:glycosyltransferase involved in cell wall biosynthesis
MNSRPLRVMWLLNHTTARKFEIPMLKRIGVREIFLPKIGSSDPSFRSSSVDWSEDENLTIPKEDLAVLNAANWYGDPGADAWRIADQNFDVIFFIVLNTDFIKSMGRHFRGAKIWRVYGVEDPPKTYSRVLTYLEYREGPAWSSRAVRNLWFGQAYSHLADVEPPWLAERAVYLPAGLPDTEIRDQWRGGDKRIFFVCPDLAFNPYYQNAYRDFKSTFAGIPYVVAGAQPVSVEDDHVLGYQPHDQHQLNMREFAVMYYPSTELNHVHYHPFEAVRAGMPLVFLAGGLLDKLGGAALPGSAKNPEEARKKIERILGGDRDLIQRIRDTQKRLLATMTAEHCEPAWRTGFQEVLNQLKETRTSDSGERVKKRIGIIVPVGYRGGTLRGAKLLARAVLAGSRQHGAEVEVVFGHLDDPTCYAADEFDDLPQPIERRPYIWRSMSHAEATRACAYAGQQGVLTNPTYILPDDGINQFLDCDLWIIISDRLSFPLLPIRPYLMVVYDYLQRYQPVMDDETNQQFINRAHAAEAIIVTTEFTAADARQFAGLRDSKVRKLPLLAPEFSTDALPGDRSRSPSSYFIWTTNLAVHKNHENALQALRLYYEKYGGTLECHVTGVGTKDLFKSDQPHLKRLREIWRSSKVVREKLRIEGELPDHRFRMMLCEAAFLWHPARIDNGTFSVIEAAALGVPSLSSDYPAMREIDREFSLNLTWASPAHPDDMAQKLRHMEAISTTLRERLPSKEMFANKSVDRLAGQYWQAIEEFL